MDEEREWSLPYLTRIGFGEESLKEVGELETTSEPRDGQRFRVGRFMFRKS